MDGNADAYFVEGSDLSSLRRRQADLGHPGRRHRALRQVEELRQCGSASAERLPPTEPVRRAGRPRTVRARRPDGGLRPVAIAAAPSRRRPCHGGPTERARGHPAAGVAGPGRGQRRLLAGVVQHHGHQPGLRRHHRRRSPSASPVTMSWVASIFFIGTASLLPVSGRLADRVGRRRIFRLGPARLRRRGRAVRRGARGRRAHRGAAGDRSRRGADPAQLAGGGPARVPQGPPLQRRGVLERDRAAGLCAGPGHVRPGAGGGELAPALPPQRAGRPGRLRRQLRVAARVAGRGPQRRPRPVRRSARHRGGGLDRLRRQLRGAPGVDQRTDPRRLPGRRRAVPHVHPALSRPPPAAARRAGVHRPRRRRGQRGERPAELHQPGQLARVAPVLQPHLGLLQARDRAGAAARPDHRRRRHRARRAVVGVGRPRAAGGLGRGDRDGGGGVAGAPPAGGAELPADRAGHGAVRHGLVPHQPAARTAAW